MYEKLVGLAAQNISKAVCMEGRAPAIQTAEKAERILVKRKRTGLLSGILYCNGGIAAAILCIDVVGDNSGFKASLTAQRILTAESLADVFRYDEFDTFYQNVATVVGIVGRDRQRLHAPLMFFAVFVNFG